MPPSRAEEYTSGGVLEGATPPPMSAIERGHRFLDPVAKRDLDRFGGTGDLLVRDGALVRGERREHVLDQVAHLSCRLGGRDADPQPREALAHLGDDRAHPVMRPRTAPLADADLPEGEIDVVVDDE